jgi:hypothetical protein
MEESQLLKNVKNGRDESGDRDSWLGRLLPGTLDARSASVRDDARSASVRDDARSASVRDATRSAPEPDAGCLDAETIAAWADDNLGREERTAAEAHAADCARCQALLAAMVRTVPPPVAARPAWRSHALAWMIPMTAAAAAIVIWVIVPGRAPLPTVAAPAPSPPAAGLELQQQSEGPAGASNKRSARYFDSAAPAAPVTPPGARAEQGRVDARDNNQAKTVFRATDALARSETSSPGEPMDVTKPKVEAQSPPQAPTAASALIERPFMRALGAAAGPMIVSSNPARQWRIVPGGPGGAVQRSTDGGSTWQTQMTGVSVTLAAGASPTPSVCWLVGPAGTVVLSTDGSSWRRLGFPEVADLVSVTATDDKTATVTAADGRMFSTADGGLTWARSGI